MTVLKKSVSLTPGQSEEVSFIFTPAEARAYQVSVNGLTGSFMAFAVEIRAAIVRAYVYDLKGLKATIYWNGYMTIGLNSVKVDLTLHCYPDTYFGFLLINNSSVALPFDFTLWANQWVPPNKYVKNIPLIPTTAMPIPMSGEPAGNYEADKKLLPGYILEPGQKGFIAVPYTYGRRWCYIYCKVTCQGKDVGTWYTGGWGGY